MTKTWKIHARLAFSGMVWCVTAQKLRTLSFKITCFLVPVLCFWFITSFLSFTLSHTNQSLIPISIFTLLVGDIVFSIVILYSRVLFFPRPMILMKALMLSPSLKISRLGERMGLHGYDETRRWRVVAELCPFGFLVISRSMASYITTCKEWIWQINLLMREALL